VSSPLDDAIAAAVQRALEAVLPAAVAKALEQRTPNGPGHLLDQAGLAYVLNVSQKTVTRLEAEGMPFVKLVEARRYELDAVLSWLRARTEAPGLRVVGGKRV
jgi:hypothetical protein